MVKEGRFRSDLYYRLNVFPITVPPLRSRADDIPFLVWHFVKKYAARMNRRIDTILSQDMAAMIEHSWPGNVRELQNFVERSVILSLGTVLRPPLQELKNSVKNAAAKIRTLAEAERDFILEALRSTDWVVGGENGAAARLGVKRTTLLYKMRRLGISRPSPCET
jgi:formate hydrogenlyase transcriptional activator